MTKTAHLFCSTALVLAMAPQYATADVTADDVWQNQQDYMATLGGDLTTSAVRNGDTLSISDVALAYQLPFDMGSLTFSLVGFSMTEQGDGTVAITYATPTTIGFAVEIAEQGSFSGNVDFSMQGYVNIASGAPGDVTYEWSVDRMGFQSRDIELHPKKPTDDQPKVVTLTAAGSVSDMSGTTRVAVAELVSTDSSYSFGRQDFTFGGEADDGRFTYKSGADGVTGFGKLALPRNGMDIMNLAAALREGLAYTGETKTTGYHTSQITEENDVVVSSQSSRVVEQTGQYALDNSGLRMKGTVVDAEMEMQPGAELPFLLRLQVEEASGGMTLPLSAGAELQDVAFDFLLEGLTMAEDMWALFDPQQTLPRDPMTIKMDLLAKVLNKVDWLDFLTVKAVMDSGEVPVELHEMTLNDLRVDIAGAQLTGSGAGRFDNSDLESLDGFPKPIGVIDLALKGGNGLLDSLVAMGLLSDEDAMGARMATAVFTTPDPDTGADVLKSRLEMTEEGYVLANGQRLK